MTEKILLVDDDANLLSALQRQLRKRFSLVTAQGGDEALAAVRQAMTEREPYAVVLSDMRMPGMDGIETLTAIKEIAPETVRMMLTGNADQQTAVTAVNQGNIFRFYTKPCPAEDLAEGLLAGLEQYRLVTAERDLLEKTLSGSIQLLVDVLSMNDPPAHRLAMTLHRWVQRLTTEFKMPQRWQLGVAAMLAPIGNVAIPPDLLARKRDGAPLSATEKAVIERAPQAGRNLVANIPRLAKVAEIVYLQDRNYDGTGFPADGPAGDDIPLDARLLKILKALAEAAADGPPTAAVFARLDKRRGWYDPRLLRRIRGCLQVEGTPEGEPAAAPAAALEVAIGDLKPGDLVLADIKTTNGRLILAANTELSAALVERLHNLRQMFTFPLSVKIHRSA